MKNNGSKSDEYIAKIPWAIQLWPEYLDDPNEEGILVESSYSAMASDIPFLNLYSLKIVGYEDKKPEGGWNLYQDDSEAFIYRSYKGMFKQEDLKAFCGKILKMLE